MDRTKKLGRKLDNAMLIINIYIIMSNKGIPNDGVDDKLLSLKKSLYSLYFYSLGSDVSDHFFWSEYRVNRTRFHAPPLDPPPKAYGTSFVQGAEVSCPNICFHCLHENQVVLPEYYLIFGPYTPICPPLLWYEHVILELIKKVN